MNKHKTLTYCSFMITSLVVVLVFVSATTYIQLAFAILLYFPLAYFAFKVFPRKTRRITRPKQSVMAEVHSSARSAEKAEVETIQPKSEGWGIADIDKRAFLKLIGGAGLALFLFSIFNKKGESQFFGKAVGSGTVYINDTAGKKIDPAQNQPTDGYRISEVDDNIITFYGFTNKDGAWFVMREDTDTGSFRYVKGDSSFSDNWTNREKLKYDYYNNIF